MIKRDRYPGYDLLAQRGHWDETTRKLVLDRVENVPRIQNLTPPQRDALEALCARVIPQEDVPPEWRVPIAPWIDQNSAEKVLGGYVFEDMPTNDVAWRWGLEGLDQTARALFGSRFADLDGDRQNEVLKAIREGNPPGEVWQRMPAERWWKDVALSQITGTYYAHPYAWEDIGFGGPAYPRGYFALNHGAREPWEVDEAPAGKEGERP
ncbi:MAG: gluconate 2-dehydrogenase subunit 3 family protein [Dehalococcoidales bacterium]|nr:gluconate 2-dehydrogenase subunit 3 family protein [Dehalococcoidales bacterium]